MYNKILDSVMEEIENTEFDSLNDKENIIEHIEQLKRQKLNVMFVGATGVGKSSTINAIFNMEIAEVGYGTDPETEVIQKYEIDNMILWDTPGLGDEPGKDRKYAINIVNALKQKDENGELLIDEVVVLIDGSSKNMKTEYEIIEKIILPYIGDEKRIIIAINQCDMALKGRHWNHDIGEPDEELISFLNEKVLSVKDRIEASTGVIANPIYYSALHHYNISKLLLSMISRMSETKRYLLTDSLNKNPEVWEKNDNLEDYNSEIINNIISSLSNALNGAAKGAAEGAALGNAIPIIGRVVGAAVGGILGFLGGLFK